MSATYAFSQAKTLAVAKRQLDHITKVGGHVFKIESQGLRDLPMAIKRTQTKGRLVELYLLFVHFKSYPYDCYGLILISLISLNNY